MGIRLTQVFIASLVSVFCMVAFATGLPDAQQALAMRSASDSAATLTTAEPFNAPNMPNVVGNNNPVGQVPVLLAKATKVFVCHFLPNGKFITQEIPQATADKLIADHPHEWVLGKCEDVISPS
jgi:hypothetical protein